MALSPVIFQAMAACPEGLGYGPHVLASWAQGLVMAALHCLAAEKPSPWALSLDHQVAAPCLSTSKLSRMALRMIHGAWLPMMRVALTWSLTMAQQLGGGLSMGGAFVPGEHLLLMTASSVNSVFHSQLQSIPQVIRLHFNLNWLHLFSRMAARTPGMIGIELVSLPEAASVLITSWP